jgi:hypothetical protein
MIFLKRFKTYILKTNRLFIRINHVSVGYHSRRNYYNKIIKCIGKYETLLEFTGDWELNKIEVLNKKESCILCVESYPDYDNIMHDDYDNTPWLYTPWLYTVSIKVATPNKLQKKHNNSVRNYKLSYAFSHEKIMVNRDRSRL